MRQLNFCPNCGTPVTYVGRFCGNCGVNLNQYQQQPIYNNTNKVPQEQPKTAEGTVTPMRTEIFKLVANLLDKPANTTRIPNNRAGTLSQN